MYTALVVDDEPVIRFGIKASLDWNQLGVNIVGDFANGRQALSCLESQHIDLLLTDIKMPVMDGIALTKKALRINPRMKVILISSYNDFEYVREGLRLGVMDYILKPTLEPEDLKQLVMACIEQLETEKRRRDWVAGGFSQGKSQRGAEEQQLKKVLIHRTDRSEPDRLPAWLAGGYTIVCVRIDDLEEIEEQFGYLYTAILFEELQEAFYHAEEHGIAFRAAENELILFMPGARSEAALQNMKRELEAATKTSLSFGYDAGAGVAELERTFDRSCQASRLRFFKGKGLLTPFAECDPTMQDDATLHWTGRLDDAIQSWRSHAKSEDKIKKEACEIIALLFNKQIDVTLLLDKYEQIKKVETLDELIRELEQHIAECQKILDMRLDRPHGNYRLMEQALAYIEQHYSGPLTLQQVADHVHISKNYFCILFKKHTNQNFIDYVIQLRINKAKRLLESSGLRIYEVAERAGFNDVKYFSKLFKKMTAFSPGEYREKRSTF